VDLKNRKSDQRRTIRKGPIEPGWKESPRLAKKLGELREKGMTPSTVTDGSRERLSKVGTKVTTQGTEAPTRKRKVLLLSLLLGAVLSALVAVAQQAEAAFTEKVVFSSNRTTGTGVNNPTGDFEIFRMNPDGTGVKQLTANQAGDFGPVLSPDKTKVAYNSFGKQTSNPEGDFDVYIMNASDGSGKKNLSKNGTDVNDYFAVFSPGGKKIVYTSQGEQGSNPEGDGEVYRMNALDGSGKKNLTNNGLGVQDSYPQFSPDGAKIAYHSYGTQDSNPEGDQEIYRMNALDGTGKKNLSNNDLGVDDSVPDYSPDGQKIAYMSKGQQISNAEGDGEVYRMNALDGTVQKNLSNNGDGINDLYPLFSSDGTKVYYETYGMQSFNVEGDREIYRMNTLDGTGQKNLTNNGAGVYDGIYPD
jgi:Tol biopolymer transport system component